MKRLSSYTPKSIKRDWKERIRALARTAAEETATRRSAEVANSLLEPLVRQMEETNATLEQWAAIWRHEGAWPPPPPKHLQVRVVGGYVPGFIESGYSICQDLGAALAPAGKRLADFPTILDFGCGCGRVIRALKSLLPSADLHGTDIDAEAIAWLTANYRRFGTFAVAPHLPPLPYAGRHVRLRGRPERLHAPAGGHAVFLAQRAAPHHEAGRIPRPDHARRDALRQVPGGAAGRS